MPGPLGGGTAIANNCGFESGAPVASGDRFFGTDYGHPTASGATTVNTMSPGMWVRCNITWQSVEPSLSGNGPYTWGALDTLVGNRNGCRYLLIFRGTSADGPGQITDAQIPSWAKACAAISTRYTNQQIGAIEVFNEPDLHGWNATFYGRLCVAAGNAVAAAQASRPLADRTKLLAGSWSGGIDMAFQGAEQMLTDFYAAINGNTNIDMVSYHPYHRAQPPEKTATQGSTPHPKGMQFQVPNIITAAASHGWHGNFAVTEFGVPTNQVAWRDTEANQGRYEVRQAIMMLGHGGGKFKIINQFQMFGSTETIEAGGLGIIRSSVDVADNGAKPGAGTFKPLYYAWRTLAAIIDGSTISVTPVTTPDPTTNSPFRYRYDKSGGKYGFIFWNVPSGTTSSLTLTGLPTTVRRTCISIPPAAPPILGGPWAQGTLATTSGSLTLTATNDPTYIDEVW